MWLQYIINETYMGALCRGYWKNRIGLGNVLSTNPVLQVEFFQLGLELILFEVHMTMFSAQEIWSGPQSQRNGTILTLATFIGIVTISLLTTDYKCFGRKISVWESGTLSDLLLIPFSHSLVSKELHLHISFGMLKSSINSKSL